MPETDEKPTALALEIMPTGLSLITYSGDTPLECLAHAALDDPQFEERVGGFRSVAEAALGKGFKTQIWMSDEHLRVHCAMLRAASRKDRRVEAASALSAMTRFDAQDLCFDLGAPDSEGYTPIAAIPREKMEEALAFARKIQLNPHGVTTSDDVAGFSVRPDFAPVEQAKAAPLPARVAGIAALAVLPLIGLGAGVFDGLAPETARVGQQVAFVASVVPQADPSERLNLIYPGMEAEVVRPTVALGAMTAPAGANPVAVPAWHQAQVTVQANGPELAPLSLGATDSPHLRTVMFAGELPRLPKGVALSAERPADMARIGPRAMDGMTGSLRAPAESLHVPVQVALTAGYARQAAPVVLFAGSQAEWRDARPRIDVAATWMPGLTGIRNAAARDFPQADSAGPVVSGFDDARAVQVANIEVPVLRPQGRPRLVNLQPSLAATPLPRPGAKLPEQAFDFDSLVPMTADGQGTDRAPAAAAGLAAGPSVQPVRALAGISFDPPVRVSEALRAARIEAAERRAGDARDLALLPPPRRDVAPVLEADGALVQTEIGVLYGEVQPIIGGPPPVSAPADPSPQFLAATQLSALSLDTAADRADEPVAPMADVAALPRPPARPDADEQADPAIAADGPGRPPARPVTGAEIAAVAVPAEVAEVDPGVLAARSAPELRLPVPPKRPVSAAQAILAALDGAASTAADTPQTAPGSSAASPDPSEALPDIAAVAPEGPDASPDPVEPATGGLPVAAVQGATIEEIEAGTAVPSLTGSGGVSTAPVADAASPGTASPETDAEPAVLAALSAPDLRLPVPPKRPAATLGEALAEAGTQAATDAQAGADAQTTLADVALAALALPRPPARPKVFEQLAAVAPTIADADQFASPQAIPLALQPISRPDDLSKRAERIRANRPSAAVPKPVAADPGQTTPSTALRLPSSAQVARVATIENGINLGGVSLIGVFGTANARRALVRLPQGRYVQVSRGDRVQGWTVSAISEDAVRVQKGSQASILRMPQ